MDIPIKELTPGIHLNQRFGRQHKETYARHCIHTSHDTNLQGQTNLLETNNKGNVQPLCSEASVPNFVPRIPAIISYNSRIISISTVCNDEQYNNVDMLFSRVSGRHRLKCASITVTSVVSWYFCLISLSFC